MAQGDTNRRDDFDVCSEKTQAELRARYGLGDVTYEGKMSAEEIEGLRRYLGDKGVSIPDDMLTYRGMETASAVLCRWPRPSELARIAEAAGAGELHVWRAAVTLKLDEPSKWVGMRGSNLIALTMAHDLLYAWLQDGRTLFLYGPTKGSVLAASKNKHVLDSTDHVNGKPRKIGVKFGVRDRWDWEERPYNPSAKPFVPAVATPPPPPPRVRQRTLFYPPPPPPPPRPSVNQGTIIPPPPPPPPRPYVHRGTTFYPPPQAPAPRPSASAASAASARALDNLTGGAARRKRRVATAPKRKGAAPKKKVSAWVATGRKVEVKGGKTKQVYRNAEGKLRVRKVTVDATGTRKTRYIKF